MIDPARTEGHLCGTASGWPAGAEATVTLPYRRYAELSYPDDKLGSALVREGVYEHEPVTIRITNP